MSQRIFPREDLSQSSLSDLKKPVRAILKVVLLRFVPCIVLGFGALSAVFGPGVGWHEGLWLAPFHALSALNDAGFSLFADSLSA